MGEVKKKNYGDNATAITEKSYMYYLKAQPWLPHYLDKGTFVAPGGAEKKEVELEILGAVKKEVFLWPRYWMNEKSRMMR